MKYTDHIEGIIKPVDVKIYLEDGIPYLDYTGTVTTKFGKFLRILRICLYKDELFAVVKGHYPNMSTNNCEENIM